LAAAVVVDSFQLQVGPRVSCVLLVPSLLFGSLCSQIIWFGRASLAHTRALEFVLLSSEKVGRYVGFRQMKEHNLGLKTGMGSVSYLSR